MKISRSANLQRRAVLPSACCQAMRKWRKPLIVLTPKTQLRNPTAASPIADLARPHFLNVLPETEIQNVQRLLICTGKIGFRTTLPRVGSWLLFVFNRLAGDHPLLTH